MEKEIVLDETELITEGEFDSLQFIVKTARKVASELVDKYRDLLADFSNSKRAIAAALGEEGFKKLEENKELSFDNYKEGLDKSLEEALQEVAKLDSLKDKVKILKREMLK